MRHKSRAMKAPQIDVKLRDVADGCRSAGIELLRGAVRGWDKAALAAWLVGPYRELTRLHLAPEELAWADVLETGPWAAQPSTPPPPPSDSRDSMPPDSTGPDSIRPESTRTPGSLPPEAVARLLARTHREVTHELGRFAQVYGGDPMGFVFRARARGHVIRCVDARGRAGFVPVATRGAMRLSERVFSLFATDYLLRPKAYDEHCTVCARCHDVVFDPRARTTLECGLHVAKTVAPPADPSQPAREQSGVQLKKELQRDTWREFPAVDVPKPPKLPRLG